jgi:hypothetical protein
VFVAAFGAAMIVAAVLILARVAQRVHAGAG